MKKIKLLQPEVVELIQDAFDALLEKEQETNSKKAIRSMVARVKKAEDAVLALQIEMDTASICEEAHARTVRECKKRGIKHTLYDKKQGEYRYTAQGQRIFDRHFDEVEAWAEQHKIRV